MNNYVTAFFQLARDKKALEDKIVEFSNILADEEDKGKLLAKTKSKQEAIISDLEEQVKDGEKVLKMFYFFSTCSVVFLQSWKSHRSMPLSLSKNVTLNFVPREICTNDFFCKRKLMRDADRANDGADVIIRCDSFLI